MRSLLPGRAGAGPPRARHPLSSPSLRGGPGGGTASSLPDRRGNRIPYPEEGRPILE